MAWGPYFHMTPVLLVGGPWSHTQAINSVRGLIPRPSTLFLHACSTSDKPRVGYDAISHCLSTFQFMRAVLMRQKSTLALWQWSQALQRKVTL